MIVIASKSADPSTRVNPRMIRILLVTLDLVIGASMCNPRGGLRRMSMKQRKPSWSAWKLLE